jgi:hypothetical protein
MATTTFNDLITFSRGSNATVTGPNGLIQWAPSNLLTNSQDFESSNWGKAGLGTGSAPVVTSNVAVAPDGTTTADLVAFNRGAGNAIGDRSTLSQLPTILNGYAYAATIYIKAATAGDIGKQIAFRGVAGVGYQVVTLTADWVRISTVETSTGTAGNFELASRGTVSADNQVSAHVWGAQLELGPTATTYNNTSVRNLLGFSEAFDTANWNKTGVSMVPNAQANPVNGLFNAQKLMENTANVLRFTAVTANQTGTFNYSVYMKAAGRTTAALGRSSDSSAVKFDLVNGVVLSAGSGWTNASITSVGNGWYRCAGNITLSAAWVFISPNDAVSYTGDGNSGVYIYGAMLSNSASLDPYVPTPGAAPSSTAYYGPRFDYDPATLLPRGLLVEEARTNLALRSAEFTNASWTKSNATVTANVTNAPDGTATALKLAEDAATGFHGINQLATLVSGTAYTQTFFVKAAERNWIALTEGNNVTATAYFNLATGAIGTVSGTGSPSATIVPFGNGWYRVSLTFTPIANAGNIQIRTATADGTANYAGTVGSGVYVWGAQLEAGAFATSYIPTIASTVTRSADVATITGSLFSQWYNQQTGSFIAEWAINNANSTGRYIVKAFSPSVAQGYGLWLNSNSIDTRAWIGATSITAGNAALSTANKAAFGYRAGDNAASVNGIAAVASSATGPTDATYLEIGSAGASYFNGWLRSIRYVPVRAADFQLQQVTT